MIIIQIWRQANQITIWKKQLLDDAPAAFSNGKYKDAEKKEVKRDHLYQKVSQLQMETLDQATDHRVRETES